MGIVGIGMDLVELSRMVDLLEGAHGGRLVRRILTEREAACAAELTLRRRAEFVAGRFAAKEAVAKALGCGIGGALGFTDIELLRGEHGKPACTLSAGAVARLGWTSAGVYRIHVTITHERSMAAAMAIVEAD